MPKKKEAFTKNMKIGNLEEPIFIIFGKNSRN